MWLDFSFVVFKVDKMRHFVNQRNEKGIRIQAVIDGNLSFAIGLNSKIAVFGLSLFGDFEMQRIFFQQIDHIRDGVVGKIFGEDFMIVVFVQNKSGLKLETNI